MDQKHTPGPWQHCAKLSPSENHHGFDVYTSDGWALASVQPADEDGIEGEANARLIAAAPKLLEALELVESAAAAGGSFGKSLSTNSEVFEIVRSAIAKATGGEV